MPDWLLTLLRERYPRPRPAAQLLTLALRPAATHSVPIPATSEEQLANQFRIIYLKDPLKMPERYLEPHA